MNARAYELYTPAQVRAVIGACDEETPTGARDAALLFVLWCSGLRIAEACDLVPSDIDRRSGAIWVSCGKGGRSRTVVTPRASRREMWKRLDRWLKVREAHAWTDSPLFCNLHGQRLDASYFRKTMAALASKAGVDVRFHPHGLRHTFAAAMHLAGVPLDVIQRQLGHADLSITGAYLRRIAPSVVHEMMEDFDLGAPK